MYRTFRICHLQVITVTKPWTSVAERRQTQLNAVLETFPVGKTLVPLSKRRFGCNLSHADAL